jgi:hypothetical protein
MSAPDHDLDSGLDSGFDSEPGQAGTWEGDVENQAAERPMRWRKGSPKTEEK